MSLNTDQKKGSAIGYGMPWRSWLAVPVVSLGDGEKLSLLKLCSDGEDFFAPNIEGAELKLSGERTHFRLWHSRSHLRLSSTRPQFRVEEE